MFKHYAVIPAMVIIISIAISKESKKVTVSSTIDAVTVFSDRAMVMRTLSRSFDKGLFSVEVPNLPARLMEESVRVSGRGAAKATILGVEIKKIFLKEAAQKRIVELEEAIKQLKDQVKILDDRLSILNQKQQFVESISVKTPESISKELTIQRPSVNEWNQLLDFIDGSLVKIFEETRQISEQKQKLKNELDVLARELRQHQRFRSKEEKSAFIDLLIDKKGPLTIDISYVIRGAGWTPLYDARVASDTKEVELTYQGVIRQQTGEDWKNVSLILSTAKPSVAGKPPELSAWYLDQKKSLAEFKPYQRGRGRLQGEEVKVMAKKPEIVSKLQELRLAGIEPYQDIVISTSKVSEQGIITTFSLPQEETVLSNNEPQKVTIAVETFTGEMEHFAVPKLSENAFLRAKVTNNSESPLLSGKVNVFFNGNFVTTSSNPLVLPTESFDLYLGVDERVKVKREMVTKFTDESGMITKTIKKTYEYKIIVENYRQSEENIVVKDQIPVAQHSDIEVEGYVLLMT